MRGSFKWHFTPQNYSTLLGHPTQKEKPTQRNLLFRLHLDAVTSHSRRFRSVEERSKKKTKLNLCTSNRSRLAHVRNFGRSSHERWFVFLGHDHHHYPIVNIRGSEEVHRRRRRRDTDLEILCSGLMRSHRTLGNLKYALGKRRLDGSEPSYSAIEWEDEARPLFGQHLTVYIWTGEKVCGDTL